MTKDLDVFCSILGRESKKNKTCWSLKLPQEHTNMRRRKKRLLFLTLERSREEKKKAPRDVPHLTNVSSIAKYYRTLPRFPRPVLRNPPSEAPTSPAEAKLFAGAKTGLERRPLVADKSLLKTPGATGN